jgi:hypothetical protein
MSNAVEAADRIEEFGREQLKPGRYYLDLSKVADTKLVVDGQPSTFMDALRFLHEAKIKTMPNRLAFGSVEFVTDKGKVVISEPKGAGHGWTALSVLRKLMELVQAGADIDRATWFYYQNDWSQDADELHIFFVVYDNKIVSEQASFMHCEPLVLKKAEVDSEPTWYSESDFDEAFEIYWYRKFYTETVTGQLMVLRPDEPILYHYDRPRTRDVIQEVQFVTLLKMYRLLWVVVPLLAAIAFPTISIYMAILAIILTIDVLWRCWETRKVGQAD